jgi:hypothetical protein
MAAAVSRVFPIPRRIQPGRRLLIVLIIGRGRHFLNELVERLSRRVIALGMEVRTIR